MQNFEYYSPCKIVFGRDAEKRAGEQLLRLGVSRVLIVYGSGSVIESGLLGRIQGDLKNAGILYELYGGVKPNPMLSFAKDGIRRAFAFHSDFILAVGGGSVIDTAKAIAHGVANPEADIWDYWLGRKEVEKSLPIGVVLTISAAGSETSDSAVLTNEKTGDKRGLSTDFNVPRIAFMNPELTYTLPDSQISCGIVDIMMHTLDRYFTHTKGNELTDEIAEAVLRTVIRNGLAAMADHCSYNAMSELMWCGSISHNRLTGLGAETDFAPHMLGHELSAMFDVAHGASLSALWGSWALYSYKEEPARFARYGEKVWGIRKATDDEAAVAAIDATVNYFRQIGAPVCFTELGIGIQNDDVVSALANKCISKSGKTVGAFKKLDFNDIFNIYKLANV